MTPSATAGRTRRAAPMSPPERRAAIVAATIPLLRRHGPAITTRQIAEAAGVAEGTIFSVFPDKDSLILAAVETALDPGDTVDRIAAVGCAGDLAARLVAVVTIVQDHVASTWQLLAAMSPDAPPRRPARAGVDASARLVAAIEPVLDGDAPRLRHSTGDTARALLALTLGCSHPSVVERPMSPEQIVDLLLDGVRDGDR